MSIPHLLFDQVAPGRDFHAALSTSSPTNRPGVSVHTQDFHEMMYITAGSGIHWINGEVQPMTAGDLYSIGPTDCHGVTARPGEKLHLINIAYRSELWYQFCTLSEWDFNSALSAIKIPDGQRGECLAVFERGLLDFHEQPSRLSLCRFWTSALVFQQPESGNMAEGMPIQPIWLARACREMRQPDNLRLGLPQFIHLSEVTSAHLSRSLRVATGQTPTEFINTLRLKRASTLLATTDDEIIDIALECGIDNLSYFYRLFREKYGQSPRAYRVGARRAVTP